MNYKLIENNLDLHPIEKVLVNRGISKDEVKHYLNTTEKDLIDYSCLKNIQKGVDLLNKHINQKSHILVVVDSDVDGYTSAAILLNYIYDAYGEDIIKNFDYFLHTGKQHGVEEFYNLKKAHDYKLIICPDAGSNENEIHKEFYEQGIDVLILDHHEVEEESQYACVINNQLGDYPNKTLSGGGVVYKFCCYMDYLQNTNFAIKYIDLCSLALISDMMDLRTFETRYLVEEGLKNINSSFMNIMHEKAQYKLGDELTPIGIAFYITPSINATIRVGTQEEKEILFKALLHYEASKLIPSTKRGCKGQQELLVVQACRNCTNLKNKQTRDRDKSLEYVENLIIENDLNKDKVLMIPLPESGKVPNNITGLIANQLMSKYQKPVLLLHKRDYNDVITWEGSGRNYGKSDFEDFRSFIADSGWALYAQGHASAFGAGFSDMNLSNFKTYANAKLANYNFQPCYLVDFLYQEDNVKESDILDLTNYSHIYGQCVDEPYIAVENIKINKNNIKLLSADKNPTLKITLSSGIDLIKFGSSKEEYENLLSPFGYIKINVVGKCGKNSWMGNVSAQILVEDYEITEECKYYF